MGSSTELHDRFKHLSEAEALRALYIDFEGCKDEPPVLLGVLRRSRRGSVPHVHQDIVDPLFAPLGESVRPLVEAVRTVVGRAERHGRRIVSWSEYDLGVVRGLRDLEPDLVHRFEVRYANARAVAERWRNKVHHRDRPDSGKLVDYLALIGYPIPEDAVAGDVARTVRAIRARLERGLPPTPGQLERWRRLLEHNRYDCAGMRHVCLVAAREIDAAVVIVERES